MRKTGLLKRIILSLAVIFSILSVSACKGIELENKTEQVEEYTKSQAMILLANERNRYQNAYSPEIWKIVVGEDGTTFDTLLIGNVKDYLEMIKLLTMMAEERGISLSSMERDQVRQMTETYLEGLSAEDQAYIGCSKDDIQKMYTDYYTAAKMALSLTDSASMDLSDSEVKVIRISQIGTTDLKKAMAILKRVKIDGANFNSMASRYSELSEIEVELKKSPENGLIENTAFSLEEGEISNILCRGDMYYIIRCVNGYDKEATEARKEGLVTAAKSLQFRQEFEPYRKQHNVVFFEPFWSQQGLLTQGSSTVENFFEIFESYASNIQN